MSRFVGSSADCLLERLPPVLAFRHEKLVSIEKSLEKLQTSSNQLCHSIQLAKQKCYYPSEHGLTRDESAAIYIYTMEWGENSLYRLFNQALRSKNRQQLENWFPYLRLFDSALEKLPEVEETVWRGVSMDIGKNYLKNQRITWWGITSCALSVNAVEPFLGQGQNSTLFSIRTINGKNIRDYAEFQNEDEIVLPLGTQLQVKADRLEQQNASYIVDLFEINHHTDERPSKGKSSGRRDFSSKIFSNKPKPHKENNRKRTSYDTFVGIFSIFQEKKKVC